MLDQFRSSGLRSRKERQFRGLILLNFLCVVFLVACGGIFLFVNSVPSEATQSSPATVVIEKEPALRMVDVLIPLRMIESGETLQPAMFRTEPRPESAVSERIVKSSSEIQGAYARSIIMPGEPLSRDYLTGVRPTSPIQQNIPDGYRAVTVNVDIVSSVEAWARPGAHVDVYWTSQAVGKSPTLKVIVQNALVLSMDRSITSQSEARGPAPATITLLVSAHDAAKVQLAQTTGKITLSLRGSNDHGKDAGFNAVTLYDLTNESGQNDSNGVNVRGHVQFKKEDGSAEEMVIINNQIIRKSGDELTR